jgi:hypothetical protein
MDLHTIRWRRLDTLGQDRCRLVQLTDGWSLEGIAAFIHEGIAAQLTYRVCADAQSQTTSGAVQGWVGDRSIVAHVERSAAGKWKLNGKEAPQMAGCADLDLGFTPATNLFQLRRIALKIGEAADVPVAWFDVDSESLERMEQRYERRDEAHYWYDSPGFHYHALLEVDEVGFVVRYPKLWVAEEATFASGYHPSISKPRMV